MENFNEATAYLIGLITGKGYIENNNKVSIEFPFVNEYVEGIAHCPLCGFLATKPSGADLLKCKNTECINSTKPVLNQSIKKRYHQPSGFRSSIKEVIIPFLKSGIEFEYTLVSNSTCSFLTLTLNQNLHSFLKDIFYPARTFSSTKIPEEMSEIKEVEKVELINGLLDSIGFANAGGWINKDGENGHGRMRVDFQIINRNYFLPVSIDNFLRENFNLPIQTIDWGHPNIRDSNLADYMQGKPSAFGREHQVKFYPEYYQAFKFRISTKAHLFKELLNHNLSAVFRDKEDWYPNSIKEILESKVKATHPMEHNPVLHKNVRTHVDALWQVNMRMGCKFVNKIREKAENKELFDVTGIIINLPNAEEKISKFKELSDEKMKAKLLSSKSKKKKENKTSTNELEVDTYPALVKWLKRYIQGKEKAKSFAFDTSSQTLFNFFSSEGSISQHIYDSMNSLSIRPDVVGFSNVDSSMYFIESKIVSLGLKELGQIMAYCHVANPKEAFLITTKKLTDTLLVAIARTPNLIEYGNKKTVTLGVLRGDGTVKFFD